MEISTRAGSSDATPEVSTRRRNTTVSPTMPKAGALSMTRRRSNSPSSPVMRPWIGAGNSGAPSTSWTCPSVIRMAPAILSAGASAAASARAAISAEPSSATGPPSLRTRTTRVSIGFCGSAAPNASSSASTAASAAAVSAARSPMARWLSVSSTTTKAISESDLRSSRKRAGLASAASSSANAPARRNHAGERSHAASATSASATTPAAAMTAQGTTGSKTTEAFTAPTFPEGPAHAPDPTCSCRSAHTLRD